MIPENLSYTAEHEWVELTDEGTVRIVVTDYAQKQLGDIVFVQLPEIGEQLAGGATLGEIESTKSVSEVYAPLAGEIVARNDALDDTPETINTDPYGEGWIVELRLDDASALDDLLDSEAYAKLIDQG